MEPTSTITFLLYTAVFLLAIILIVLLRINHHLSNLSLKNSHLSQPSSIEEIKSLAKEISGESPKESLALSGTRYEEFLKEDPSRSSLSKKEKFIAYRKWRKQKGLNWNSKD